MPEPSNATTPRSQQEAGISAFLAMVVHDLRSPAGVVSALASLLDERWDDLPAWQRRDVAGRLARASHRLDELLARTLDEHSLRARRFTYEPEGFDVGDVIRDVVHDCSMTESFGRISVDVPMFLPQGHGDPVRHRQILTNLLAHAARSGAQQTSVGAREEPPGMLWLTVEHDGHGIAALLADADPSGEEVSGTALGLVVSRTLVEEQGGEFLIEHSPEGTTIRYSIPVFRSP